MKTLAVLLLLICNVSYGQELIEVKAFINDADSVMLDVTFRDANFFLYSDSTNYEGDLREIFICTELTDSPSFTTIIGHYDLQIDNTQSTSIDVNIIWNDGLFCPESIGGGSYQFIITSPLADTLKLLSRNSQIQIVQDQIVINNGVNNYFKLSDKHVNSTKIDMISISGLPYEIITNSGFIFVDAPIGIYILRSRLGNQIYYQKIIVAPN